MADELARCPDGGRELGSVNDHVQATLEQSNQILRCVALHGDRLRVILLELLLGDVAVIALQLLLRAQLDTVIAELALASLAMLAGAIFAAIDRALGPSEDV